MSDSVRPHRRQPTRLPRPWDSPGKNTGVGCYCHLRLFAFVFSAIHNQAEKVTTSNLPILGLRALLILALRDSCLPLPLCTPLFVPQLPAWTPMPHRLSQSHGLRKARRGKLRLKQGRTSSRTPCPGHRDRGSSLGALSTPGLISCWGQGRGTVVLCIPRKKQLKQTGKRGKHEDQHRRGHRPSGS